MNRLLNIGIQCFAGFLLLIGLSTLTGSYLTGITFILIGLLPFIKVYFFDKAKNNKSNIDLAKENLDLKLKFEKYSQLDSQEERLKILKKEISNQIVKSSTLKSEIKSFKETIEQHREQENQRRIMVQADYDERVEQLEKHLEEKKKEIEKLEKKTGLYGSITSLQKSIKKLKEEIEMSNETIQNQEVGFYEKAYDFITSEEYKEALKLNRQTQKTMISNDDAMTYRTNLEYGGSLSEGNKMVKHIKTVVMYAFNGDCDAAVARVTYKNIKTHEKRIQKTFEKLNSRSDYTHCEIKDSYLQLKLEELHLAYEFYEKKAEEAEEQREIREQMREEEKMLKEIEKEEKRLEQREKDYAEAIIAAEEDLREATEEEKAELKATIKKLKQQIEEAETRKRAISQAQITRKGHVYIISNSGSFGDNIYKIGLTRRLEPYDRVKELGDASVPFPFDVHAMIYAEDAPTLEKLLHKKFEKKKVNMINEKKEFFRVSIDEIEKELRSLKQEDKKFQDLEFEITKTAEAEQYKRSLPLYEVKHE